MYKKGMILTEASFIFYRLSPPRCIQTISLVSTRSFYVELLRPHVHTKYEFRSNVLHLLEFLRPDAHRTCDFS